MGCPHEHYGCHIAHRFYPPWCWPDRTTDASLLFCSIDDRQADIAGTSLLGRDHMPTGSNERSLFLHELAPWVRFRRERARRNSTPAIEGLPSSCRVLWLRGSLGTTCLVMPWLRGRCRSWY